MTAGGVRSIARRAVSAARRPLRRFARAARAFREEPPRPDPFARRRDPAGPELVRMPAIRRVGTSGDGRVTLLMPGLEMTRMTGGPNTALNLVGRLAEHGIPVRVLASIRPIDPQPERVRAHIEGLVGRPMGELLTLGAVDPEHPLEVAPDDVFVATSWETAYVAEAARATTSVPAFVYLIQDFEAGFFAYSTMHALALATYAMPVRPIFNERTLREHFVAHRVGVVGADPDLPWISFEPAVDRTLFRPTEPTSGRRRLLFYGRPRNERNCFDLGLRALRMAVERGALAADRWDVVSMGAEVPELDLGRGQRLRPAPWLDYRAYAEQVSGSDAMLALMLSPHSGYPALEMAAAGGRVVTNTFSTKTAEALARISPALVAAAPEPESLARAIVEVGAAAEAETGRAEPRLALPATWAEAFREPVEWLIATTTELREAAR